MSGAVRITIRVHPGASRTRVAPEPPGQPETSSAGNGPMLGVWVTQRAVEGKATQAALDAVADALGVRSRAVRLVTGARSRVKIIEVTDPPADLGARMTALPG